MVQAKARVREEFVQSDGSPMSMAVWSTEQYIDEKYIVTVRLSGSFDSDGEMELFLSPMQALELAETLVKDARIALERNEKV